MQHLSPRSGSGDRQLSDAPLSLFILFYPVRVSVSIQTESNPLLLFDFFSILDPILDLHTVNLALVPLLENTVPLKRRSRVSILLRWGNR